MASLKHPHPEMAARARARREHLGLPKNQLAVLLDVGTGRISQIEAEGLDSISGAVRWADVLQMDPIELIFGSGASPAPSKTKKGK